MTYKRYLAFIDSDKLHDLFCRACVVASKSEYKVITGQLADVIEYNTLVAANYCYQRNEDKVFLIADAIPPMERTSELVIYLPQIQFLICLDEQSEAILEHKYPAFIFKSLPSYLLISFIGIKVHHNASMGISALRMICGLDTIEPDRSMLKLQENRIIPPDLLTGLSLKEQNVPYYQTSLEHKTLLSLTANYQRTQNYPNEDIGFVYDLLEIYYYLSNRSNTEVPSQELLDPCALSALNEIYQHFPTLSVVELAPYIARDIRLQRFYNIICTLTAENCFLIPLLHLKGMTIANNINCTQQQLTELINVLPTLAMRENLAVRLGSCLGFEKLARLLYINTSIPILDNSKIMLSSTASNIDAVNGMTAKSNITSANSITDDNMLDTLPSLEQNLALMPGMMPKMLVAPTDMTAQQRASNDQTNPTPDIGFTDAGDEQFGIEPLIRDDAWDLFTATTLNNNNEQHDAQLEEHQQAQASQVIQLSNFMQYNPSITVSCNNSNAKHTSSKNSSNASDNKTATESYRPLVIYTVKIANRQKKISDYIITNLVWFKQSLAISQNLASLTPEEILKALTNIINTQAPITIDLLFTFFKHMCRNSNPVLPFTRLQKAKLEHELNYILNADDRYYIKDGFIYRHNKPVFVRFRGNINISGALKKKIRAVNNVSDTEIVACYNFLIKNSNLSVEPVAKDILTTLGLAETKMNLKVLDQRLQHIKMLDKKLQLELNTMNEVVPPADNTEKQDDH